MLEYFSEPGISIVDPVFSAGKISFGIQSFSLNKRGGFGLLKVVLRLYDPAGKEVYRKSNTLRAGKKQIKVSTMVPREFTEGYRLTVSVLDLIANRLVTAEPASGQ